jgi:hypothetical protein
VVKSVSSSEALPTSVPSQLQESADLLPQAQAEPETLFSFWERLHVHSPAGRWSEENSQYVLECKVRLPIDVAMDLLHEHLAPEVLFSVEDFSHVHWRAGFSPQEHLASFAQTQPPSRPQQVTGTAPVVEDIVMEGDVGCWLKWWR